MCPIWEKGEICDMPAVLLLVSNSEGDPGEDTVFLLRSLWVINKRCSRPHIDMECAHSITHPGKENISLRKRVHLLVYT